MTIRKIFKTYGIIKIEDLSKIDFFQVGENSANTIRKNVLNPPTQFLLKWDNKPTFILDGTVVPDKICNYDECLELMKTEIWLEPEPEFEE